MWLLCDELDWSGAMQAGAATQKVWDSKTEGETQFSKHDARERNITYSFHSTNVTNSSFSRPGASFPLPLRRAARARGMSWRRFWSSAFSFSGMT